MNKNFFLMSVIFSSLLMPFSLAYIFITYVKSLENKDCKCSADIRRKYIKYYGYILLLLSIIGLFIIIYSIVYPKLLILNRILKYFSVFISLLGIYVLYSYSEILELTDCDCANSWKRVFIKYYSYFMISIMALTFLLFVLIFVHHITFNTNTHIKIIKDMLSINL